MMTTKDIRRAVAVFLGLSLILPSPALALRDQEAVEKRPEVLSGLEEALRGDPSQLVQLANTTLGLRSSSATPITSSLAAISPRSAAGMEEWAGVRKWGLRILLGTAVGAGAWMVANEIFGPRPEAPVQQHVEKAQIDPNLLKRLRADLRGKVAPGAGLYLWEFQREMTAEEFKRYLPRLLDYVKDHQIRKVYVSLPTPEGKTMGDLVLSDVHDFEKQLAQWTPLLSELRKAGVQVWLTYYASWWGNPDHEWGSLNPEERGTVRQLPRDTNRFLKDPEYAARYDLDYAVPVHTRYHLKALERIAGNADFQKAFQGLYVHLEPYWTVGWTDKAGEETVNRYLEQYLKFLESAHQITTEAKLPMMVNSWQGALEVPAGIHQGARTPGLVQWQGKPLLEAVRERAEIANVWIQGVEPRVSTEKLSALLAAQNPALPLEITLELFDHPDRDLVLKNPDWPKQLWGIVGEISQRWPNGPFSVTIRGDRGGQTAAPSVRSKQPSEPKKAGMEESIEEVLQRVEQKFPGDVEIAEAVNRTRQALQNIPPDLTSEIGIDRWPHVVRSKKRLKKIFEFVGKGMFLAELRLLERPAAEVRNAVELPGTSVLVLHTNPTLKKKAVEQALNFLAETFSRLRRLDAATYNRVTSVTKFLRLEDLPDAMAMVDERLPGGITLNLGSPVVLTPPFDLRRKPERLRDVLTMAIVHEAAHLEFKKQWKRSQLIKTKYFRFKSDQQSVLTNSLEPYFYLLEADGYLAMADVAVLLLKDVGSDSRRGDAILERLLGSTAADEFNETVLHLESIFGKGILTREGEDMVRQQRLRRDQLFSLIETVGLVEPQEFGSVDAFLEKYGQRLQKLGLLNTVEAFRGANRILALPDVLMSESVIAYSRSSDTEWVSVTEERLKSDFVLTVPYPENQQLQFRSVVIQQEGMDIPQSQPAVPVLVFRSLEELKQRLTPGFVYAVAVNKNLAGQVIGPIIGILTFLDEQGRTIHAVFA